MSPYKKKQLIKLRNELDRLDLSLINIIKKRYNLVKKVLNLKDYRNQIVDKKRINFILREIKKNSLLKQIDPKVTHRIWKNMIYAFIDYEKRNFKKK